MEIRKSAGITLAAALALSAIGASFPLYENTSAAAEDGAATAAIVPVTLTTDNASLFLPGSYEQYLPLEDPTDVAFSDNYIAIADGNTMYICTRGEDAKYTAFDAAEDTTITKIQFSGDTLYFSLRGTGNSFWYYDCSAEAPVAQKVENLNCSTFLIVGDTLYTAVISGGSLTLASRSLDALDSEGVPLGTVSENTEPDLAYAQDTLYCIVGGNLYFPNAYGKFDNSQVAHVSGDAAMSIGITSVCSDSTYLYYSSSAGLFRRNAGADTNVTQLSDASDLTAMTFFGNNLYCIDGQSVREIAITGDRAIFTSYEITSASGSVNRLNEAADTARAGDLLVTADRKNSRISVYDFTVGGYTVIPCAETPSLVSTDGSTIAYASGAHIYTCTYGETIFSEAELPSLLQPISGLACVYGTVYYVTENGMRGSVGGNTVTSTGTPTGLAADLYGNLYVSYANAEARKFTETEFTTQNASGMLAGFTVPNNGKSLKADYKGNVYYLSSGQLYRNGELFASFGGNFVWTSDGTTQTPTSFAIGFEDDEVYFNYGNYVVKSNENTLSGIPTLNEIPVGEARETAFSYHGPEGLLVTVPAGTVGIETDLDLLLNEDSESFPYEGYARKAESQQGIYLAESDGWSLILLPNGDGTYVSSLFPSSTLIALDPATYYSENNPAFTRYISSEVSAYYVPCLEGALSRSRLARGTNVKVIGTLTTVELRYALVEYAGGARGYVPLSYLSATPTGLSYGAHYTLAYLKSCNEGITFTASDGTEKIVTERVEVRLYENGDGTYTAQLTEDLSYSAVISADMIDEGNAEVIRVVLIVILTVLGLLIIGVYIFLLPWEKYRKKRK